MRRLSLGRYLLPVYAALAFVYLLTPIAYTFAFSFNDAGKSNLVWRGFTWDNWRNPCGAPAVCESVVNSLAIGLLATLVSTVLGTMVAIALVRYRFRFRATTNLLLFLPMATPEVVLGAALLAQFLNLRVNPGFTTIVIATSCSASASWWSRSRRGWPRSTRTSRRPRPTSTPRPGSPSGA